MPELPEVQTIVSDLEILVGQQFVDFFSSVPKAIKNISAANFTQEIIGQKIKNVSRLGKIILIRLDNNKTIAIHLKMTGKLIIVERKAWNVEREKNTMARSQVLKNKLATVDREPRTIPKHLHHIFFLKNKVLKFYDVRKFATISLLDDSDLVTIKNNYGLDPITDLFFLKQFSDLIIKGKTRQIKEVLMNNALILGIGNIYASEILFDARILPNLKTNLLTKKEIAQLHKSITKILTKAIRLRGTSISDYRDANDKSGSFQKYLYVYRRNGQKCKKCATIISRSVIGQRSTFFCAKCQN
ncbi:MAG: bifunctional DNA-formamidopyrimidine glycosylase/DNA-(apurinic or apyrimidinic site) lyase [Candidatus Moraniibacteriota bacterium]